MLDVGQLRTRCDSGRQLSMQTTGHSRFFGAFGVVAACLALTPACATQPSGPVVADSPGNTSSAETPVSAPPSVPAFDEPAPDCDRPSQERYPLNRALERAATRKVHPPHPSSGRHTPPPGRVLVEVVVDRDGRVVSACIHRADAHMGEYYRRVSRLAAMGWRFKENFGLDGAPRDEYQRTVLTFKFWGP